MSPRIASPVIPVRSDEATGLDRTKWLNSREAAAYLRTSVAQIRNMVHRGQLASYKPFGRLLFKRTELEKCVEISRKGDLRW